MSAELKRVLVIDDASDIRTIASLGLKLRGLEVIEAPSGEAGLALAASESPDLILLDVKMPELDGPETFARLKAQGFAGTVVFLTAKVRKDEVAELLALGADGVLAKPFDPLTLAEQVRAIYARR